MSEGSTQYYLKLSELKRLRSLLPKKDISGTAAQKVAKKANKSASSVYKVLSGDFQNKEILYACCQIIIEDSEQKKATALTLMQELTAKNQE